MFHGHASADGMVIIEISPEKTKHHFHKALLVYHLEYFARALVGPCLEAEERRVALDDVDTDACEWLSDARCNLPSDFILIAMQSISSLIGSTRNEFLMMISNFGV